MALTLTFNLANVLERNFSREQRRTLTPEISRGAIKREFGQRAIEEILRRTNSGKDVKGTPFTPYSKAYKQSDAFTLFGKSSTPNLKLTGEMHSSIVVIPSQGSTVKISIPGGEQEQKARRHNFGIDKMPRREFFGLTIEDQGRILKGLLRDRTIGDRLEQIEEELSEAPESIEAVTQVSTETPTLIQDTQVDVSFLSILGRIIDGDL